MIRANIGLVIGMAMWGAQVPIIGYLAVRFDPWILALGRYAGGLAVFIILILLTAGPGGFRTRARPGQVLALGVAMALFSALYTAGLASAHPVTAAIIAATGPATAALVAWAAVGDRPRLLTLGGMGLAVAGGVFATVDLKAAGAVLHFGLGEVLIMGGGACWSWYSLMAQRWMAGEGALRITTLPLMVATVVLTGFYAAAAAAGDTRGGLADVQPGDLPLFALLALGVMVLGVFLWNNGVRAVGVVVASMYLNLIPLFAILIALSMGATLRLEQVAGGMLVLAGVLVAQADRFGWFGRKGARP